MNSQAGAEIAVPGNCGMPPVGWHVPIRSTSLQPNHYPQITLSLWSAPFLVGANFPHRERNVGND
jgi:hypothetical protein